MIEVRRVGHQHLGYARDLRGFVGDRVDTEAGDKRVHLAITDLGGMSGLAAMAGWANMTQDRETQDEVEKVYKDGNRTIHEEYRKDGSHAEYSVVLANGVIVEAKGDGVDVGAVKAAAGGIDLGRIESMKRAQKA